MFYKLQSVVMQILATIISQAFPKKDEKIYTLVEVYSSKGMWSMLCSTSRAHYIYVLTLIIKAESRTLTAKWSFKEVKVNLDYLSVLRNRVPNILFFKVQQFVFYVFYFIFCLPLNQLCDLYVMFHSCWILLVTVYFMYFLSVNSPSNQLGYYEMMDLWSRTSSHNFMQVKLKLQKVECCLLPHSSQEGQQKQEKFFDSNSYCFPLRATLRRCPSACKGGRHSPCSLKNERMTT